MTAAPTVARLTLLMALVAAPAAGELQPCSAANEPGTKVLLDDIVASAPELETLANTLAVEIERNLEELKAAAGIALKVRACKARRPQAPSDFDRRVVEQLLDRDVALEVWGRAVKLSDAAGPFHQAEVGYVIVPVRFFEFASARPPGAFVITHRIKSIQSIEDLVGVVNQSGRIGAYAALASGTLILKTRSLRSGRWEPARKQLCRASAMLRAIPEGSAADTDLLAYAGTLIAETLAGARADPEYQGTLKFLPVGDACPL